MPTLHNVLSPQPLNWQLGGVMPICSWEILLLSEPFAC